MDSDNVNNKQETETNKQETDVNAFCNDKVDVEIEPDVKSNKVYIHLCSCSIVLNCFGRNGS